MNKKEGVMRVYARENKPRKVKELIAKLRTMPQDARFDFLVMGKNDKGNWDPIMGYGAVWGIFKTVEGVIRICIKDNNGVARRKGGTYSTRDVFRFPRLFQKVFTFWAAKKSDLFFNKRGLQGFADMVHRWM